ncbi:unnamed protein product [Taenia asiatica]|uniref:Secreted protein n=1 Tax=Taenia asiatica TaxID=60517 RepID=A0A0R3VYG6_TAEAS|nr:unnamed protein product [Taenia asiatica]
MVWVIQTQNGDLLNVLFFIVLPPRVHEPELDLITKLDRSVAEFFKHMLIFQPLPLPILQVGADNACANPNHCLYLSVLRRTHHPNTNTSCCCCCFKEKDLTQDLLPCSKSRAAYTVVTEVTCVKFWGATRLLGLICLLISKNVFLALLYFGILSLAHIHTLEARLLVGDVASRGG